MAFDIAGWGGLSSSPTQNVYSYATSVDTLVQVSAAGYFSSKFDLLHENDLVRVEATDGAAEYLVRLDTGSRTVSVVLFDYPSVRGIRLAVIGDSIINNNHSAAVNTNGRIYKQSIGEINWAQFFEPRFNWDVVYDAADPSGRLFTGLNFGVAGDTTAEMLARFPAVLAANPDLIIIAGGTNDIDHGDDVTAVIIPNLVAMITMAYRVNIPVVLFTIRPRLEAVQWVAGRVERYARNRLNAWIKNVARAMRGVTIFDPDKIYCDAIGGPKAGYMFDNTHPSTIGAFYCGQALAALLASRFPAAPMDYLGAPDDIYDAALNPFGNISQAAYISGSGGTLSTGASGVAATGVRIARNNGSLSTCVASVVVAGPYGNSQRLTFTLPGGGSGGETWNITGTTDIDLGVNQYAAGSYVQNGYRVKVPASDAVLGVEAYLAATNFSADAHYGMHAATSYAYGWPNAAAEGWVTTSPMQVPASPGMWRPRLLVTVDASKTGTLVIDVQGSFLRKIEQPY